MVFLRHLLRLVMVSWRRRGAESAPTVTPAGEDGEKGPEIRGVVAVLGTQPVASVSGAVALVQDVTARVRATTPELDVFPRRRSATGEVPRHN